MSTLPLKAGAEHGPNASPGQTPGVAAGYAVTAQKPTVDYSPQGGGTVNWHVSFTSQPSGTASTVTLADEQYTAQNVHDAISTLADELETVAQHPNVSSMDQTQEYTPQTGQQYVMNTHVTAPEMAAPAVIATPVKTFKAPEVLQKVDALVAKVTQIGQLPGSATVHKPAPPVPTVTPERAA